MLPSLNLLPWREMRREKLRKQFFTLLSAYGVLAICIVFSLWFWLSGHHEKQQARNSLLQQEITLLRAELKAFSEIDRQREILEEKIGLVDSLQQQRKNVVSLFNLIPQVIPRGVALKSVNFRDGHVILEGMAKSGALVSEILKNLESNPDVRQEKVHSIDRKQGALFLTSHFRVTFYLHSFIKPKLEQEDKSDG
ncbi:PilN domain-containing protein [Veronia pacifica]|uniref:Pilus assembly protein PilN n=1 Tax=Veronia pacifica TaxID=1080227 RepID=A0A1C3EGL2_9GAMM|nr:PilN domain-containing protein [Veronia pacifica]ODA32365.1 hypothetical protein A8L45_12905 [Veronia pacifica]